MTSFFNPSGYKTKLRNYRLFRKASQQQGLKLLAVELAFGRTPFELAKGDADILIRLRSNSVMWQKERLLNVGFENLPKDCDKVAWLDCDIVFSHPGWVQETADLLEHFVVVRPYSMGVRLLEGVTYVPAKDVVRLEGRDNHKIFSTMSRMPTRGDFGLACAIRRSVLKKHGLYDKMILGSADTVIHNAFFLGKSSFTRAQLPGGLLRDQNRWAKAVYADVRGSVSSAKGLAYHLWHGDHQQRYHIDRHVLNDYAFNFRKDIKIDRQGCWTWSSRKKELHDALKDFFRVRNEDGDQIPDFKDRKIQRLRAQISELKDELYSLKHKPIGRRSAGRH
ncbi:MAG: hypothetical protein PHV97_06525 [Candidatus Omnitrophica bacterium]|nr:hypothetical protein [Candidatus Omnitrophota bacterium]